MQVKTFEKEGVGSVRAVMRDGEPYVCARDVARACGYGKATSAVRDRCAEPPTYMPIGLGCGNNSARVIGEADVFRLCAGGTFHADERSRAGEWLFGDVFPSMRREYRPDDEPLPRSACDEGAAPEEIEIIVPEVRTVPRDMADARSLICKLRNAARESGNSVRANALADALAVMDGAA